MNDAMSQKHAQNILQIKNLFFEPTSTCHAFSDKNNAGKVCFGIWNAHKLPSNFGHFPRQFLQNTVIPVVKIL